MGARARGAAVSERGLTLLASLTSGCRAGAVAGVVNWGHEVRSFRPCGGTAEYWLIALGDAGARLRSAAEAARERHGIAYARIYAELVGAIEDRSDRPALGLDYDGVFTVRRILRFADSPPPDCAAPDR